MRKLVSFSKKKICFQNFEIKLVKISSTTRAQVATIGIHFNHSKEYRRAWQYCTVLHLCTIITVAVTLFSYVFIGHRSLLFIVSNFTAGLIESASILQISISFAILLRAVYNRFAALNEIFGYGMHQSM